MTIQTNATIQPPAADTAARAQEIRRRLPGQARRQRLDTARLEYGPLYSLAENLARRGCGPARAIVTPDAPPAIAARGSACP